MLVSGGGGEVAVFDINFCLPSKVDNFSLVTSGPFSRHLKDRNLPPKDYDMKRAWLRTKLHHKSESSKLSL